MFPVIIFFRNHLISLIMVIENSYTYLQELILLNIVSSQEQSDYEITYWIVLWKLMLTLILLNIYSLAN